MKEAIIYILEDDLINGLKHDLNSKYIIKFLHRFSIKVRQVNMLGVSKANINEIVKNKHNFDVVIVSGGTGQKHSVQTYETIAECLNVKLVESELVDETFKCTSRDFVLPESATILNCESDKLFIVKMDNIYFLPGCPIQLRAALNQFQKHFLNISGTFEYNRYLHVKSNFPKIKELFDKVVDTFKTVKVSINSSKEKTNFTITLESTILNDIMIVEKYLKGQLKELEMRQEIRSNMLAVYDFAHISNVFLESIQVLEKCFTIYKPDEVFLSFNGGKDCTVLLYLALAVYNHRIPQENTSKIQCVYIQSKEEPFDEIVQFIEETIESYNLPFITIKGTIQEALTNILENEPKYKAVLMGTRRSDPFSENLEAFQMTDKNWPQIMRVSPILDWSYSDVWDFLHQLQIPYCSLYDQGYTSLGNKNNTDFNFALHTKHGYLPAYFLENGSLERQGRINNNLKKSTQSS